VSLFKCAKVPEEYAFRPCTHNCKGGAIEDEGEEKGEQEKREKEEKYVEKNMKERKVSG
jgi:hypothetical protein